MVSSVSKGLLDSFKKIQQHRNALIEEKEQEDLARKRRKVESENQQALQSISFSNNDSSTQTMEQAENILRELHRNLMNPRIVKNYDLFHNLEPARTALSVVS